MINKSFPLFLTLFLSPVSVFAGQQAVLSPDHIKRGQEGECLTVFEGDTIEPFRFRVKGVMHNFLGPKGDLILVKLLGDKPEFTGVVAGMSGSPCSIDGKLIGALSYAFAAFAKEPIAGITPMQAMYDVMALPKEKRPWRKTTTVGTTKSIDKKIQKRNVTSFATQQKEWEALRTGQAFINVTAGGQDTDTSIMRPIATPLNLGGFRPEVRRHFTPWLRSKGFEPVAAGISSGAATPSKGTREKSAVSLQPGDAVAAVLVRGDADIAATGTVTSVRGREVLAFGHPFMGVGAISVPMAKASILNTMVSQQRSFKMSETGEIIGEITQDRLTAIGGYLGAPPAMIPVTGKITTASGTEFFHFEVARDLALSPKFLAMGLANSLSGRITHGARGLVRLTGIIEVNGMEPITIHNVMSSERDANLMTYAAIDMARAFATMWETPFGPPPGMKLNVEVSVDSDPIEEWVEAIFTDRAIAFVGDEIDVAVQLRRVHGNDQKVSFKITVPTAWAGEEIKLVVAGTQTAQQLTDYIGKSPRPKSLNDIHHWLQKRKAPGQLYLLAFRDAVGMQSEVNRWDFLPPSMIALLSGESSKHRTDQGIALEKSVSRPGVVLGSAGTSLRVFSK